MFDMRGYIVSLFAVFLALGMGILLGTVIVDKGILIDQQNAFLKKIATQVNDLRAEKNQLQDELDIDRQFMPETVPYITRDRLKGKTILVFCTSNAAEQTRKTIQESIRTAGGESILYVLNMTDITNASDETKNKLKDLFEVDELTDKQLEAITVQNMIEDIVNWDDLERINALAGMGWMSVNGSLSQAGQCAVVIGEPKVENKDVFKRLLGPIVKTLAKNDIPVIGVEKYTDENTNIEEFKKLGANSTVDHIDTIPGQIAVIFALAGNYGDFGAKETAQSLIPELTPLPAASENVASKEVKTIQLEAAGILKDE